ncbi:MAG: PrsW family intramembrane metalloprotease [Bacteroidaceae bacterium]|nr:PrsW family intramembrane metalloprotease [Bacteroidaceae bacterium]
MEANIGFYVALCLTQVPVAALLYFIYRKDELKPEPVTALLLTFVIGAVGGAVGNIVDVWSGVEDIYRMTTPMDLLPTLWRACIEAAPDSLLQVAILLVAMWRNKYFDEQMDGVVYAVFIAMGYILGRNILYLYPETDNVFTIGVMRSMLLVPIYYFCGVVMGYYYSRLRFRRPRHLAGDVALLLVVPFLCRVVLDATLLRLDIRATLAEGILMTLFLIFLVFFFMHYTLQRIESLFGRDEQRGMGRIK